MKIDKSNSLKLSGYLICYRTSYSESNRYRLTLNTSKSHKVDKGGNKGEIEILGEF